MWFNSIKMTFSQDIHKLKNGLEDLFGFNQNNNNSNSNGYDYNDPSGIIIVTSCNNYSGQGYGN